MQKSKYEYTEEEYQNAIKEIIRVYAGKDSKSQIPKLVFAAGQPGSGKSILTKKIIRDYARLILYSNRYGPI